jgi:hypothetical protein
MQSEGQAVNLPAAYRQPLYRPCLVAFIIVVIDKTIEKHVEIDGKGNDCDNYNGSRKAGPLTVAA